MKKWMFRNRTYVTGTCAISSRPLNSTLYFAVMGAMLLGSFRKKSVEKASETHEGGQ